jgi:cystatin-A/B
LKGAIEAELGQEFQNFELVNYSTQVVAGTIYLMRVKVDGEEYLHVKIIKPLPHTNQPPAVMSVERGMTLDSPLLPTR